MEDKGLEFGKIYRAGNFVIKKFTRTLTKEQMLQLRDAMNIPRDVQKRLERNGMQFIKASTISGSWSVEWVFGMSFFKAIDEMPVNENGEFYGTALDNLTMILTCMFADTSVVGDMEYMAEKQKLMHKYFDRMANKSEMSDEEIKESEEAADEVLKNEEHKATLINMAKEVNDDRQND